MLLVCMRVKLSGKHCDCEEDDGDIMDVKINSFRAWPCSSESK